MKENQKTMSADCWAAEILYSAKMDTDSFWKTPTINILRTKMIKEV